MAQEVEHSEQVIRALKDMLGVDEDTLAEALGRLMRAGTRRDHRIDFARQAGVRILNHGPDSLVVDNTDGTTKQLQKEDTEFFLPEQFARERSVPNVPYRSVGILPSAYLHLVVRPADESATCEVEVDWEKVYLNSGIWGNLRPVLRIHRPRGVEIDPARQLRWHLKIGGDAISRIELVGVGVGVDILARMEPKESPRPEFPSKEK